VNIPDLLSFHRSHGKMLTVTAVRPPGRFGDMEMGPGGRVVEFNEKPQVTEGYINGGYFVASPRIFDVLQGSQEMMFEQEPIRTLVRAGEVMAYPHNGFWQPMDTFAEYTLLNTLWMSGSAPWRVWQ
jgi:glucose-1-phosphate cytidylyltransferase